DGDIDRVLPELSRAGGSPGGARPKVLVAIDGAGHAVHGSQSAPAGHDHYLVKFRSLDDPLDAAEIEHAYSEMARAAGVLVPETKLLPGRAGEHYFASRRFDRHGVDDNNQRVHVHSASGLLYADIRLPSLDYQDLVFLTRAVTRDQRDCKAMVALAVFNVLAHNRDDHARQFSYIMERGGRWCLAPAYDLTFSEGPGGEHSTSVIGRGKDIGRESLLELGRKADFTDHETGQVIETVGNAVAQWSDISIACGVTAGSRNRIAAELAKVRV
ncbi:MAG: HipA domain-containing protein, partial [Alphaproteobacteria bacterium]